MTPRDEKLSAFMGFVGCFVIGVLWWWAIGGN